MKGEDERPINQVVNKQTEEGEKCGNIDRHKDLHVWVKGEDERPINQVVNKQKKERSVAILTGTRTLMCR